MIWLLKPDHPKATEFAPAMDDSTGILPGLPSVMGKPVHVAFDEDALSRYGRPEIFNTDSQWIDASSRAV